MGIEEIDEDIVDFPKIGKYYKDVSDYYKLGSVEGLFLCVDVRENFRGVRMKYLGDDELFEGECWYSPVFWEEVPALTGETK